MPCCSSSSKGGRGRPGTWCSTYKKQRKNPGFGYTQTGYHNIHSTVKAATSTGGWGGRSLKIMGACVLALPPTSSSTRLPSSPYPRPSPSLTSRTLHQDIAKLTGTTRKRGARSIREGETALERTRTRTLALLLQSSSLPACPQSPRSRPLPRSCVSYTQPGHGEVDLRLRGSGGRAQRAARRSTTTGTRTLALPLRL